MVRNPAGLNARTLAANLVTASAGADVENIDLSMAAANSSGGRSASIRHVRNRSATIAAGNPAGPTGVGPGEHHGPRDGRVAAEQFQSHDGAERQAHHVRSVQPQARTNPASQPA